MCVSVYTYMCKRDMWVYICTPSSKWGVQRESFGSQFLPPPCSEVGSLLLLCCALKVSWLLSIWAILPSLPSEKRWDIRCVPPCAALYMRSGDSDIKVMEQVILLWAVSLASNLTLLEFTNCSTGWAANPRDPPASVLSALGLQLHSPLFTWY